MKIALTISHLPSVPARVKSMKRLREALRVEAGPAILSAYYEAKERAPNWVWCRDQWLWMSKQDADFYVALQDDLVVAPGFWPALEALLTVAPADKIIDLSCVHPSAKRVARDGQKAYTTADGLVGMGYAMSRPLLDEFRTWEKSALHYDAMEWITEDSLLNIFAVSTGHRIYHPVPTLIDHDTSLRSTYGNDAHAYRSPAVTWADGDVLGWKLTDLESPDFWKEPAPPHLGFQYKRTAWAAKRLVKDFPEAKFNAARRDVCPQPYARFFTQP